MEGCLVISLGRGFRVVEGCLGGFLVGFIILTKGWRLGLVVAWVVWGWG